MFLDPKKEMGVENQKSPRRPDHDQAKEDDQPPNHFQSALSEIQFHHKLQTAFREISLAVTSSLDLRTILDALLEQIDHLLPYSAATVRLLNRENGRLEPVACRNIDEEEWKAVMKNAPGALSKKVLEGRAPVVINDVQSDPRSKAREFFRKQGLVSYVGVPMIALGEILGVLSFFTGKRQEFSKEEVEFLNVVARQGALAIHNSELYEQTKKQTAQLRKELMERKQAEERSEDELKKARHIQEHFLPDILPYGRGLAFAGNYRPSQIIGGDLYDALHISETQVAVMIADVSGHGVPASLLTGMLKVLFRRAVEQCNAPVLLLNWLNLEVSSYLNTGEFITMFLGIWDSESHTLLYSSAGHPPALLISADGTQITPLELGGGILGVLPDMHFPEMSIRLKKGERLLLYTDGITEAFNSNKEIFGEERLANVFMHRDGLSLESLVKELFAEVDRFAMGETQADDQAFLALEVTD